MGANVLHPYFQYFWQHALMNVVFFTTGRLANVVIVIIIACRHSFCDRRPVRIGSDLVWMAVLEADAGFYLSITTCGQDALQISRNT